MSVVQSKSQELRDKVVIAGIFESQVRLIIGISRTRYNNDISLILISTKLSFCL